MKSHSLPQLACVSHKIHVQCTTISIVECVITHRETHALNARITSCVECILRNSLNRLNVLACARASNLLNIGDEKGSEWEISFANA